MTNLSIPNVVLDCVAVVITGSHKASVLISLAYCEY
jgi:hypothetical protein